MNNNGKHKCVNRLIETMCYL